MKAELIDRQRAIDEFYMDTCDVDKVEWAEIVLKRVPTVERKGKWIEYNATGKKQWMCSECCAEEKNPKVARFCYWCGAYMRGEEDG